MARGEIEKWMRVILKDDPSTFETGYELATEACSVFGLWKTDDPFHEDPPDELVRIAKELKGEAKAQTVG